jgi:chemosensory pili system protein ChpA (sensor histidine kinase/response regulator)
MEDKKILVVDDDASTRELLKAYLTEKKLVVAVAEDGLAALEALKTFTPDLVVLDVIMPKLDGYGLLREMKKDARWRAIPIVVLTAREMMRDVFVQEGVRDFLTKPYDPGELHKIISRYLK